jgi:hypothetical protein
MVALALSGLTAVPLEWGTRSLAEFTAPLGGPLASWSSRVAAAIADVGDRYPILFYGTDWLAFAHLVIALAFVGVLRDPWRNRWVVEWGIWMCALSVFFAFAWAPVRGIPFFWRCVDASFGILGIVPLWLVLERVRSTETTVRPTFPP